MKHHFWLGYSLIFSVMMTTGCFSRPVPSKTEYIQRYLAPFTAPLIDELQLSYHGAVGGEGSIARFSIDDKGITALKSSGLQVKQYNPSSSDAAALKRRMAICSRWGKIPSWYDFPFDRTLDLYSEQSDYTATTAGFSNEYFVDTKENVVYFIMIRG